MNEIIAKRYVKALLANLQDNELEEVFLALKKLASAFLMDKLKMLLGSPSKRLNSCILCVR